ncbi:ABC-2 family transporter protein [Finegoldia magna]|uniref:ABC-2 family transporter protein n=1 Tax=Finegoldia magna TaxID=1260 RepID=UPI00399BBD89
MEKYLAFSKLTLSSKAIYRKAVLFDIFGIALSILLYFLWSKVYGHDTITFSYMKWFYIIISQTLASQFYGSSGINNTLSEWIYEGNISIEILRPVSLIANLFARKLGDVKFFLMTKAGPIIIIVMFGFYGLRKVDMPGIINISFSVLCLVISLIIVFFFECMVGFISFFTMNSHGISIVKNALMLLMSGSAIPYFILGNRIGLWLNLLPFSGTISIPIQILLGKYSVILSLRYICVQLLWSLVFGVITLLSYQKVIKRVVVQGG